MLGKLSAGDMIAQDAMYHKNCLLSLYRRKSSKTCDSNDDDDQSKQIHGQSLAELASYIEQAASQDTTRVFKLTDLAIIYRDRIRELGGHAPDRVHATILKNRLLGQVPGLKQFKDKKNCYLTFEENVGSMLKTFCENDFDDEAFILFEAAKILRRDNFAKSNDEFKGTFSKTTQHEFITLSLKSFIDHLLQGNKINRYHKHLEQATLTISQMIMQNTMKRIRQQSTTNEIHRSKSRESPLGIYLGMTVHATTRKKGLVDKLFDLGISISYKRVMTLSTDIGNRVLSQYGKDNIVCPPSLKLNLFTTDALDNIDHNPSYTTAEGSFHGTGISLFQHPTKDNQGKRRVIGKRNDSRYKALQSLPASYTDVLPVTNFKKDPQTPDYSSVEINFHDVANDIQKDMENRYEYK